MATSCVVLPSPGISACTISCLLGTCSLRTIEWIVTVCPRLSSVSSARAFFGESAHATVPGCALTVVDTIWSG